ncbi:MAG: adenine deaminase [Acidaminococcaceae bacterium]|nr:adenine deaminase [Acidaminococcaceae bacterium]
MGSNRLNAVALGNNPADLLLKNGRVVDVVTQTIYSGNIAIADGLIAGVGDYTEAKEIIDLQGAVVTPGFINAHLHVESSMAVPSVYCTEELAWGVTTLITDPHEIANVAGARGIRYMLEAGRSMPINYYVQLPSCVPATPFENAGTVMRAKDLVACMDWHGVLGLGEMMNLPGVLNEDVEVMQKLSVFRNEHRPIDGHAPGVTGRELAAYAAQGITTDHESVSWGEAREKLRSGIAVWARQGSASRNLEDILAGALAEGADFSRMGFCTDDKHLADIHREGTVRSMVLQAMGLGMKPLCAIAMATINPARVYGLNHLGEIAPGKQADLVVWDDLETLKPLKVFYKGRDALQSVAEKRRTVEVPGALLETVHLGDFAQQDLLLKIEDDRDYPVIEMLPGQIFTNALTIKGDKVKEFIAAGYMSYISVLERHHATGHIGKGLIWGYGLKRGAAATTVAHDSHNLIVVGQDALSMETAVRELENLGGGYALAEGDRVVESLALEVAGLMSIMDARNLTEKLEDISRTAHQMGVAEGVDPFISLSFMALPVIPKLKITDMGLFDVTKFEFVKF